MNKLKRGPGRSVRRSVVHSEPHDSAVGRLLFNVLAMVVEFEGDLARTRTREGMKVAKGWLRGKQPKLSTKQESHLVALQQAEEHTISELEELFSVTRSTIYRAIARDRVRVAPFTLGREAAMPAPTDGPGRMPSKRFRRSLRPGLLPTQCFGLMAGCA